MTGREQPSLSLSRDTEHEARALRSIASALERIPFYAKRQTHAPALVEPSYRPGSLEALLASLPLLTADSIRASLPKVWFPVDRNPKEELASGAISIVETGLSDARIRLLWDKAWWLAQEQRAWHASEVAELALAEATRSAGSPGGIRDAVLWVPERGTGSCGAGDPSYEQRVERTRLHLNPRQDPTFWTEAVMRRMLEELALHETVALLADPFYLDVLARFADSLGQALRVQGFIGLTRSLTTSAHRANLARVFDPKRTVQVYSAREAGVLFIEGSDGLLHHAPFTTHVELLPLRVATPGASNVACVVVTTLDRAVQPLVRYVLGDLVQVATAPSRFTTVPPITTVEGKLDDCIVRPDGAIVTPAAVDRALEAARAAPTGYQVIQTDLASVTIEVMGGSCTEVTSALAPLLDGLTVSARSATAIAIESTGKYRTCRRMTPRLPLDAFVSTQT